jgi:flagellar hook assembly protein FlgD
MKEVEMLLNWMSEILGQDQEKSRIAHNAEVGPNPFNAKLNISFELPAEGDVAVAVFNVRGLKVRSLTQERLPAGEYVVSWYGRDDAGRELPSGVYFLSIETMGDRDIRKVVLLK